MSVEKTISYEQIPYTQVYNHVIQNISNMEAGFIWIYLLSKPKDWIVIKEHLKNKFDVGDEKIKKIFSYLKKHRLIDYIVHKDASGKIIKHETIILNGSKFLTDEQLIELSTDEETTGSVFHPVVNHSNGNGALQIKENTNERIITKRDPVDKYKKQKVSYNKVDNQTTSYKDDAIKRGSIEVQKIYMKQIKGFIGISNLTLRSISERHENNAIQNQDQ